MLLIADSDPILGKELAALLAPRCCVHCCATGTEALKLLRELRPQILVLDLMLPELDGLALLQNAANEGKTTMILATTPLISDYILKTAETLGVDYMMRQPCDVLSTAQRVEDLSRCLRASAAGAHEYIAGILQSLNFANTHHGSRCIPIAVMLAAQNPNQSMTKELYPEVGKRSDPEFTGRQVEKLIRYAIDFAWKHRDGEIWHRYFSRDQKPTNRVFIYRLAQLLTAWRSHNRWE